ncbi:hypothetical protein ACHAXS_008930 [Conticribra weissflogii]
MNNYTNADFVSKIVSNDDWQSILKNHHPIAVEGPGPSNDTRDPAVISRHLFQQLIHHWEAKGKKLERLSAVSPEGKSHSKEMVDDTTVALDGKPILFVTQGDPPGKTGVAAISLGIFKCLMEYQFEHRRGDCAIPRMGKVEHAIANETSLQNQLSFPGIKRVLITLDDPKHIAYADREGIFMELRLSQLMEYLSRDDDKPNDENAVDTKDEEDAHVRTTTSLPETIEAAIKHRMETLTIEAHRLSTSSDGQSTVRAPRLSTKQYAMLQEFTKTAFRKLCGEITVIHTVDREKIPPWSVTGFYPVGLDLGLIEQREYFCYDGDK